MTLNSCCAAVSNTGRLLLFSGERRPRLPVDNDLHVLDLESTSPSLRTFAALAGFRAPEPRVGASAVHDPHTNNLYVWGGRGGVDMAPLDRFQAGVWKPSLDALDTPSTTTLAWERLPAVNDDSDTPADAPTRSRGGSAIAAVTLTRDSELVPIRFGGFQLPQVTQGTSTPLDIYYMPNTNTWLIVYPAPDPEHGFPGARSVHGLVPFVTRTNATLEGIPVALLHHGERDASSVGHAVLASFGTTHGSSSHPRPHRPQVWSGKSFASRVRSKSHRQIEYANAFRTLGTALPEPHGWFPSASYVRDGKTRVVLTGGLLSSNERSGEVWVGDVEL
ncbi:galactose oxidase [Boletus edulis]|nr:galactose oxidase [Boletus edulis]